MKLKKGAKKIVIITIIIVIVAVLAGMGYLVYKRFFSETNKPVVNEVVDQIEEYGYTLEDNSLAEYKKMYDELRKILNEEEVDVEAYARQIAKMLVFDFYYLDNKISKNDIGGVQFIREEQRANFALEASETVYKYIEHNIYGKRTQKLPVVTATDIKSITPTTYKYGDISDANAYKAVVTVAYKEDMGYPSEVTVVMIHRDKKLEVIKMY